MGKIIVSMLGGLGNQMFEYAMYLDLLEKYGAENVGISTNWFVLNHAHYGYELEKIFGIKLEESDISNAVQVTNANAFYLGEYKGLPPEKDYLLTGNYGSPEILSNAEEKLRKDFAFPKDLESEFKEITDKIANSNSVSIHLRCGDFRFCNFDNGPITYYEDAVSEIKNKVENPLFFIFSDDMNFAKEKFSYLENKVFVEANRGDNSYKDLFLMSKCKHFIMAPNSTFSFWGAWLSENKDKIILTASAWKNYPGLKSWGEDFCRKDSFVEKYTRGGISEFVTLCTIKRDMWRNTLRRQCALSRTIPA